MTEGQPSQDEPKTQIFFGNIPKLELDQPVLEVVPEPPGEPRGPFTVIRVKFGGRWKS